MRASSRTRPVRLPPPAAAPRTAGEIHRAFPIADPAVSRHLRVLREAGVIVEERPAEDRRVRVYKLQPRSLEPPSAWLAQVSHSWQGQLESFKRHAESRTRK
jgi:DNA-binding transcriptional ArsR family regulator